MEVHFPESPEHLFGEDEQPSKPVALVSTQTGVPLRVQQIPDDRTPENMVCMGTIFRERLIARSTVPPEVLSDLESRGVFASPVRLGLAAVEEDPGLQCRLFALLPAEQFHEDEPEEPWTASVPRYEDTVEEDSEDDNAVVPLLLGHIVRFQRDRKHPEDLAAEAVDILRTLLSDDRPLSDVVDKVIDDLLE